MDQFDYLLNDLSLSGLFPAVGFISMCKLNGSGRAGLAEEFRHCHVPSTPEETRSSPLLVAEAPAVAVAVHSSPPRIHNT